MKFALLAVLCLAGNASAYSHSVKNASKETIRFWVNYKACSNDSWILKPGQLVTWRSGWCCITTANAQLDGERTGTQGGSKNHGEDFVRQITFSDITCGNTNWSVDGEKSGTDDRVPLQIKRL